MRQCPNCSEEIQDDAVFCRFCHTELEPSPTLTSMRRCPYCAEWVAIDSQRCQYCDRTLIAADAPHAAPFIETSSSVDDLANSLRRSLLEDDSEEAAAIAAAAAEFIAEDPLAESLFDDDEPVAAFSDFGSSYDAPQSGGSLYDRPEDESEESLAAPSGISDAPQSDLRRALYDEPYDDSTDDSLSSGVQSDYSDEPQLRSSLHDEPLDSGFSTTYEGGEQGSIYDEPQSDLRRSLYDEPLEDDVTAGSSRHYAADEGMEYVEPVAAGAGSSIWMAGAEEEDDDDSYKGGTGALTAGSGEFGRSVAGTEGVSELRAEVSGPPGRIRRNLGKAARFVVVLAVVGAATWGLIVLAQGPAGAAIAEILATDIPTETPIPEPTATRRPAPTLPPEIDGSDPVLLPTEVGTPFSEPGCVSWEAITVEDEGTEACVYGFIKRWWAGDEIPFISIFSEDEGTFSIIDRTTRYPVGPGSCIMARGTIEIMGGVRPNIDAQGALEDCPEEIVEG